MTPAYALKEWSSSQQQSYRGALEIYQAYLAARQQRRVLNGSLHWKQIRGRHYLYRYRDRYGHGVSLGPRSEQTEKIFGDFTRQRQVAGARLQDQRLRLAEQARFCRAALLHRVPQVAAKILRRLEQHEPGQNFLVVGTPAIYAYECAAGVFLDPAGTVDLLAEARRSLTLAGETNWAELLPVLRQTDRSFTALPEAGCLAANRDGYRLRLLKSGSRRPGKPRVITVPGAGEPLPPDAGHLQYLAASPKLSQIVIGQDGLPATMVVPDPRAFALNKLWWSQQEDRGPSQRVRDLNQALAVAALVLRYLPQYDYSPSELEMFPQDLRRDAEGVELHKHLSAEY